MASVTVMVCTPVVFDQLASVPPFISRSSDRGYPELLVVTPPTGALNTTPVFVELTTK